MPRPGPGVGPATTGLARPSDPDHSKLADPAATLPAGWQRAKDRVMATLSDVDGLHVLVADEKDGYAWRTAATWPSLASTPTAGSARAA